ncbi:nuclear transport factor 2 family protein [Glycomyces harbinensis]|nr:nuclear transport factor 2 family protein [Glycomyces harbinensis]
MTALTEYIDAWIAADADRIARAVTEHCHITECYGPVYRGRDTVHQWAQTWFDKGGVVHRWEVTDHIVTGDREIAEWNFECTWAGERAGFEGATIARHESGLIRTLREYQTTAPLYDWHGTWR